MSMAEPSTTDRTYQLAGGAVLHFLPKQKQIIELKIKPQQRTTIMWVNSNTGNL